ncbi:N-acetyltransferase [Microbulbifer sp. SAOS-129_SWC]|uniref:GNAT family N-acetyltransferase n=1 Tax=Microbulbifer sp. SAOS-129_SWC TaxID=3145235 RepID=UPI00321802C9
MLSALALPSELDLRPATGSDQKFRQRLFASTRQHLQQLPLPDTQIELLLEQQYRLQQVHYAQQWPAAQTQVILQSGREIGAVTVDEGACGLHIIDIALEPPARGQGYGTSVLRALQASAEKEGLTISLSVDRQNLKAQKLYRALGFRVNGTSTTHNSMLWKTPNTAVPDGREGPRPTADSEILYG